MENLLYDLYVAEGEINNNHSVFSSDSIRKANLFNSVLKKHKVTKKQLDASIEWYANNLRHYNKINSNINNRFENNIQALEDLRSQASFSSDFTGPSLIRDSIYLLNVYSLPRNTFSFRTDTTFSDFGGIFELQLSVLGINGTDNPELTFCVQCADTTFVKKAVLGHNGFYSETINITNDKRFKEAYGFIHFPEVSSQTNVFISDFRILQKEINLLDRAPRAKRTHESIDLRQNIQ
jgi:Xanthine dehydrogenase, molybdopterin-binding subunit B